MSPVPSVCDPYGGCCELTAVGPQQRLFRFGDVFEVPNVHPLQEVEVSHTNSQYGRIEDAADLAARLRPLPWPFRGGGATGFRPERAIPG